MKRAAGKIRAAVLLVALIVPAWIFLAPRQIGGSTGYVVIASGASMQPGFRSGDLAVVRATGDYEVGDAVAYHSERLNRVVFHRIVGRDGSRFIMKGDHNEFLDEDHPTAADVIGEVRMHVPSVGKAFTWFKAPLTAALAAGLATLLLLVLPLQPRRRTVGAEPAS